MTKVTIEEQALLFAYTAHEGQKRKYTNEPYITHPVSVCGILKNHGWHDDDMLAAALLHDVVEDTRFTLEDISTYFGKTISDWVFWLTDVSKPQDGNRKARKKLDREHICKAPIEAKAIKLADLIHNTQSITKYDEGFAKVYLEEKRLLLRGIEDSATSLSPIVSLLNEAWGIIND